MDVNTTSLRKGLAHQRIASISWSGALPSRNTRLYFIWQDNPRSPKRVKRRDNKRKGSQRGFYVNNCQRARTLNSTRSSEKQGRQSRLSLHPAIPSITGYSCDPRTALEWRGRGFALHLLACPPVEQNGVQQTRVFQNPNMQVSVFEPACKGGVLAVWGL